jgi:hypothetical protein
VSMTSLVPLISCLPKLASELPTAPNGCAEPPPLPLLLLPLGLPPSPPSEPSPPPPLCSFATVSQCAGCCQQALFEWRQSLSECVLVEPGASSVQGRRREQAWAG